MSDIQHSLFPDAANVTSCKDWFSRPENSNFEIYADLKAGQPNDWQDFEKEIQHVLCYDNETAIYRQCYPICDKLYERNLLKHGGKEATSSAEIEIISQELHKHIIETSTADWKEEMRGWLLSALKFLAPRIISIWKKRISNKDSRDRRAAKKTPQPEDTPQSTPKTPLPRRRARNMGGAPKPSAAKGFSPASDSAASTQSALRHSYSSSDMHSTPSVTLDRHKKRGRPLQRDSESRKMTSSGNGEDLSLEDMAADPEAMHVTQSQKIQLVNQHMVLIERGGQNTKTLCLVTITAVVMQEFRLLKREDIRLEHLSFDTFKDLVRAEGVDIDWEEDKVMGGGIEVKNQTSFEDAIDGLGLPLRQENLFRPLEFEVQRSVAEADKL